MFPIHGSSQGVGNSPGVWCCISCVAFECYNAKAHGATFYSSNEAITCQIFMIGFVVIQAETQMTFL